MGLEDFSGSLSRGDDHCGDATQLYAHHGAVGFGELRERLVWPTAKLEEVADDRKRLRPRGQRPLWARFLSACDETQARRRPHER